MLGCGKGDDVLFVLLILVIVLLGLILIRAPWRG